MKNFSYSVLLACVFSFALLFSFSCEASQSSSTEEIDYGPYMRYLSKCVKHQWKPTLIDGSVIVSFKVLRDGSFVEDSIRIISAANSANSKAAIEAIGRASERCVSPLPKGAPTQVRVDFTFP
jgi:hypothetical protein